MTAKNVVASRHFPDDTLHRQFAALTGDWNPMHMDPIEARRTQPGAPVVHGMHTLLWALEWMATELPEFNRVRKIKVAFVKWVYVGSTANLLILSSNEKEIRAQITVGDIVTTNITASLGISTLDRTTAHPNEFARQATNPVAKELQFEDMPGQYGFVEVAASSEELAQLFPGLSAVLHPLRVAALGALSQLVGMKCPGRHSIFAGLNIEFNAEPQCDGTVHYRVKSTDKRFRIVNLDVNGCGIEGIVQAFARVPPALQVSMEVVIPKVQANEFSGVHALIVGGSRGLGELTAKVIAAGGGNVTITYAVGREEAENVAREIQQSGKNCDVVQYDALQPSMQQLQDLRSAVTHAYYYATCRIFRLKRGIFSQAIHQEFNRFYVEGFFDMCQALEALGLSEVPVFYPSSVAVGDRPADMTEYAMAKAAGEILCEDINRFMKGIRVVVSRLPRLPTDQTLSLIPGSYSDPLETILPIIREVQGIRVKT